MALRLTLLAALLGLALAAPAAAPAAPLEPVEVGIADQKADMFADERFAELGIRHARLIVGWDALDSDYQVEQIDAWLASARERDVEPLITFGHSRTERRSLPTPGRFKYEFRRFRERYPWVRNFATWNEANHCGEPTCNRARLVAAYYRALRQECGECTILAAEMLDTPNATRWVGEFRRHLGFTPGRWGLHNYVEANRFRSMRLRALLRAIPGAKLWLTETGGLVRRRNRSTTDIPEGTAHAGEVTRFIFDRLLIENPRITRVYLYHWNAPREEELTWDSALVAPSGEIRSSMLVLQRVLREGLRPGADFRSPRARSRSSAR
ncbi:MAG: hypothetical protein H0T43_10220 [Solirubrobacterales bacterium]|nr:hypothetical protein [Solirubrobacterales bacterium]